MDFTGSLPDSMRREMESFINDWLVRDGLPGAAVAIVGGDGTLFADGFGARNFAANAPATADTLYGIGSCTKSFTGVAVMQLVEQGGLDLDDPISDYIPAYEDVDGDPMTLHDLLTHSSGMPSDGSAVALISRLMDEEPFEVPMSGDGDFRRNVTESIGERLTDRERFFYYNSGYTALGYAIENVDGRKYGTYVEEEILAPLGMDRATFDEADVAADDDVLTPYAKEDGSTVEASFPFDDLIHAPGGLLASVRELTAYLRMSMGDGSLDGNRVLEPGSVETMQRQYATRRRRIDGTEQGYGYGWMLSEFLDDRLVGHGGSIGVSNAFVGFLEEAQVGIAVATNCAATTHPMYVGPALLAIVDGTDPADVVPLFGLREKQSTVSGEYESFRGVQTATVEPAAGGVKLSLENDLRSETYTLFPESSDPDDYRFYTVAASGDRTPVEFRVTDDGIDLCFERWRLHKQR